MFNILRRIRHQLTKPFKRKYHFGIVYLDVDKYNYIDHDARLELAIVKILTEYFDEMAIVRDPLKHLSDLMDVYNHAKQDNSEHADSCKKEYDAFLELYDAYVWFTKNRPVLVEVRTKLEEQMGSLISFPKSASVLFVVNTNDVPKQIQDDYNETCERIGKSDDKHFANIIKNRGFMWV